MKLIIIVGLLLSAFTTSAIDVDSNLVINNYPFYSRITELHQKELEKVDQKWIDLIKYYRAFYVEGENLSFYCKSDPKVYYKDRWQRESVITSFMATLQMILLENTIQAMAQYSKELEFSEDEYEGLYSNAIASSCSANISVMGHRRIKKYFKDSFEKGNYQLPSIEGNPLFTKKINIKQSKEERLVRELYYTLGLFKAACSWGQRFETPRLLEKLLKNPVVAAYITRQMNSIELKRDKGQGLEMLQRNEQTTKVLCDGLICRKKNFRDFNLEFPKGIGSSSYFDDMKALYCQDIRDLKAEDEPELASQYKEVFNEYSGDKETRLISQFVALITKFSDFNVWTDNKTILTQYLKSGMEYFWDTWAKQTVDKRVQNLSYEEPLVLKVVDRDLFLNPREFKPHVIMDLNSGEFDEEISINGKLRFRFYIEIPKNDMKWFYFEYRDENNLAEQIKRIDQRLQYYVEYSYAKFKDKFSSYIIKGDLTEHIAKELKMQINEIKTINMDHFKGNMVRIPVDVNVSPFALIYLKNKNLMRYYLDREKKRHKDFELQNRIDSMAEKSKK
ncbi:hypothetical protein [Bacteriovorax sp. DB6_IX]|uniref:hypothetical protein n=3 Tax=Bacteriovorax sp. DB6_IX TaxID=1353530 RepID=UPI00038A1119|nr:hypothetical protein [Bacteriovorax sp. DB6_IX]EQC51367.1 hypothetical protein M901_0209 [Bacteriovorax sp. DB6_IX]